MTEHRFAILALSLALTAATIATTAAENSENRDPNTPAPVADTPPENPAQPDAAEPPEAKEPAEPTKKAPQALEAPPVSPLPRAKNVALDQPVESKPEAPAKRDDEPADAPPAPAPSGKSPDAEEPAPKESTDDKDNAGPEALPTATDEEEPAASGDTEAASGDTEKVEGENTAENVTDSVPPEETPAPLVLLGTEVPPATSSRLAWAPSQSFEGIFSPTPVLVVNGAEPGPTLCLTAAVHGDEVNGVETVRRVLYNLDANKLQGTVIGVPIVNLQGFHRGSRYLTDRRDLNRYFPGDPEGSSASRIAYSFFHEIIKHCGAVVDLHTGSFYRSNLPQLRGDLRSPQVVKLTESFGSTVVLHSEGAEGTLRRAAVEAGIPAVTLEAGAPMVLSEENINHSVKGIRTLLNHLDMVSKFSLWGDPEPVYYNSTWQRAPEGGIVFSKVSLGQDVRKGDLLGTVTNPITNVRTEIRSSYDGRVLGMAMNQVVQPGFATHHIGIKAPQEQISKPEDVPVGPTPEGDDSPPPGSSPEGEGHSSDSARDEDFEADPRSADNEDDDMAPSEE